MLLFKSYIKEQLFGYNENLNEGLNSQQSAVVKSWGEPKKARKISDNVHR
jgi:hypothetical protein